MKAKLNIAYPFNRDYNLNKGTEVLVYENVISDASIVLNTQDGMCYLCEVNGIKNYIPVKFLDITDCTPTKIIDWEQRRFELVKALSASVICMENYKVNDVASVIIIQADAIIKRLKEKGE